MIVSDQAATVAVLAALNVGGAAGSALGYTPDALKKLPSLPDMYSEVAVTRRFGGTSRADSYQGTDSFRITVRQCSKKNSDNARELRRRTRVNLEWVPVVADGITSTGVLFESADQIDEDDQSYWSGLETYTVTF